LQIIPLESPVFAHHILSSIIKTETNVDPLNVQSILLSSNFYESCKYASLKQLETYSTSRQFISFASIFSRISRRKKTPLQNKKLLYNLLLEVRLTWKSLAYKPWYIMTIDTMTITDRKEISIWEFIEIRINDKIVLILLGTLVITSCFASLGIRTDIKRPISLR